MTELMQGRSLENMKSFEIPTFDMSIVSDSFNLESHFVDSNGKLGFGFLSAKKSFKYAEFIYEGESSEQEYDYLMNILKSMNKESYLREYDYLGFYSCQMIVPGFSEVYPIEDLIYNNKNIGKQIRDMVLNFTEYDPEDILMSIEQLEDTLNIEKYIGVIFENNFTMREFKAQIYLLLGDTDEALELLEYGADKLGHIVVELARMESQELDFKEYEIALYNIFGEARVQKALRILDGDDFLIDTTLHNDYNNMLAMYDRLENKKTDKE